jgi:glycosyltransferase involved in cell wall biosynthesis
MTPLVSILMPAFNAEEWIADAIRSALDQTWQRTEVIVVDDGSEDETLAIARRFASARVSVVARSHAGEIPTRNHAFSLCQGDYVQWLDADNLLAPDKIAEQVDVLTRAESTRTVCSAAWGTFAYRPHRARFRPTALWCDLPAAEWLLRKLERNIYMPVVTWLVRRDLLAAAGEWDARMVVDSDGEYFARVLRRSDGVRFAPRAIGYRRVTGVSRVSYIGASDAKLDAQLLSLELTIAHLRALDDGARARAACRNVLQTWLPSFYPERPDLVARAHVLAAELDGVLETPRLSWKYAWIEMLAGRVSAKRAQMRYNRLKQSALRVWDKGLLRLEQRLRPGVACAARRTTT